MDPRSTDPLRPSEEQAARTADDFKALGRWSFAYRAGKDIGRRQEHERRIRERWLVFVIGCWAAAVLLAWTWFR